MELMSTTLFGKEKNGDIKVWTIEIRAYVCPVDQVDTASITIRHGKQGGKLTTKQEFVTEGKQGRSVEQQAVLQAEARIKKQTDKGYRASVEELNDLPLLAMLAADFNKVGHRIDWSNPVYGSVKLDGVRCVAKMKNGVVTLESRTGQPWSVKHVEDALVDLMVEGEVLDGELYVHGEDLQDIVSAVKRIDADEKVEKANERFNKFLKVNPEVIRLEDSKEGQELSEAHRIASIRKAIKFVIFDVLEAGLHDEPFESRLNSLAGVELDIEQQGLGDVLEVLKYVTILNEEHLRTVLQPKAVAMGYEGFMLRNAKGVYESGKRSADLQKYKTFLDEEFEIVGTEKDKQGYVVFVLKNNINDNTFNCVMGDYDWRMKVADDDFTGQFMTVQFQTRYKDTLLPQFPCGKLIREGKVVDGVFVPSV